MAALVINGDSSGSITLQAPNAAGTTTLNLPATTGTVLNDATVGVCRAWVNFNGTGTVAIRASFNVSSITDNGTGNYNVNMTTALSDANYSAVISFGDSGASSYGMVQCPSAVPTSSSFRFQNRNSGGAAYDYLYNSAAIFR